MFLHLSVILFTGGMHPSHNAMGQGVHPSDNGMGQNGCIQGCIWGVHPEWRCIQGMHPEGCASGGAFGDPLRMDASPQDIRTPSRWMQTLKVDALPKDGCTPTPRRQMVNRRTVRILRECILVNVCDDPLRYRQGKCVTV